MLARLRKATKENEGGFTLIELLVVMIIIGILAAIAIPTFLSQRNRGYDAQAKSDARNLASLMETNFTDTNTYAAYANLAAVQTALPDFKVSPKTTAVKTTLVTAAGATGGTSTSGFCVPTTSTSGATVAYNSNLGGLQSGSAATCP